MRLSKAQKKTLALVKPAITLGTIASLYALVGMCMLDDISTVEKLIYFVTFPITGAVSGGVIGSLPFVVSTIIAMFLEQ